MRHNLMEDVIKPMSLSVAIVNTVLVAFTFWYTWQLNNYRYVWCVSTNTYNEWIFEFPFFFPLSLLSTFWMVKELYGDLKRISH